LYLREQQDPRKERASFRKKKQEHHGLAQRVVIAAKTGCLSARFLVPVGGLPAPHANAAKHNKRNKK
jgi:hypothetical protein